MQRREFLRGTLSLGAATLLPGSVPFSAAVSAVAPVVPVAAPLMSVWDAIANGHWDIVMQWLKFDPSLIGVTGSIECTGERRERGTLFQLVAMQCPHLEILKHLVSLGAHTVVDEEDDGEYPPKTSLHAAAYNPNVEIVKYVLSLGDDINARAEQYKTPPLYNAVRYNSNPDVLKYLISQGADPNEKASEWFTGHNETLLHLVVEKHDLETLKHLIAQGIEVSVAKKDHTASLFSCAVRNPRLEIVKYFVDLGADIHEKGDKCNDSPLYHAASSNPNLEVLKYLVSLGMDVNEKNGYSGCTPLHVTVYNPNLEIMKYLVSQGADVNAVANSGYTPLLGAALSLWEHDKAEALEYLVSQGADVNAKTSDNQTALTIAAGLPGLNLKMLKCLISAGADVHATEGVFGRTPFHETARTCPDVECLKYLISKGADPNVKDKSGKTPFHYAALCNSSVAVLEYLHSLGADINASTKEEDPCKKHDKGIIGETPLLYACDSNPNIEILKYLVSHGADLNVKDRNGITPAHAATQQRRGALEFLEYLVSLGVELNVKNDKGQTPLHTSFLNRGDGSVPVLKYIVSHGIDVNAKDHDGYTVFLQREKNEFCGSG